MPENHYNVVGVMSGTSLDGIDLAHISFTEDDGKWGFDILEAQTFPYDERWISILKKAIGYSEDDLIDLNIRYTKLLGQAIRNFIDCNHLKSIDAVCSHGHTILHRPDQGLTLQIGNLPDIAQICGQKVVCDFRVQDVKLGGQGAPLVPIGDRILFPGYNYCLNLGGFSNLSFEKDGQRIAFDISAVNTVLNHYAGKLGQPFDDGGNLARSGQLNTALLLQLDALEFYRKPHPKSLGFEYVRDILIPMIDRTDSPLTDILHTFSIHIARQISNALPQMSGRMLVTGGGAYNDFLIEKMLELLPQIEIVIPEKKILEFKEALIFGLLGVLKLRGETNVLASVTGATQDHSSGVVFNKLQQTT